MLLLRGMHEMVCEEGKRNLGATYLVYADGVSHQGDEIAGTQKISFPFSKPYDTMESDMKTEMELWASDSAHAEEHVSHESESNFNDTEISTSRLLTMS